MATLPTSTLSEASVRQVITMWHAAPAEGRGSEHLVPYLADRGLAVHLPGHILRTPAEFRSWYSAHRGRQQGGSLVIKNMSVRLRSPLHAEAEVEAVWEGRPDGTRGASCVRRRTFTEFWSLVQQENRPRVRLLTVHEWPAPHAETAVGLVA
ncbi:hypothetical protein [Streptomyces rimosus]|uniref:hypothetical protein n=1 Tax=Streptomyces rimosus TaxID=1927 RepID=UPI0004C0998F|nr:hypothetical protein [Streptomyces rimosus]